MNRNQSLVNLEKDEFDICIIGAGASGAGCALDAALRGYKVALIDRQDFASETSSKSTKLIHGGVRYLEQAFKKLDFAQLKQVRHGLEERHLVLSNAPHLARPLALVTPVKSWIEGLYFTIGLKMYDSFASDDTLPKSRWLKKSELLKDVPTLNRSNIHSAVLYYDGQLDDARYCLALAQSASEAGAVVANYVEVTGFDKSEQGKLKAVQVRDRRSGRSLSIKTKLVLNCTGPFSDHIRLMGNPALPERLRPSKGVHAVLPYDTLNSDFAMLIPKTSDGRVVFAIPFEGAMILGTTDTECDSIDQEPVLNAVEKQYLADTLNPYLEKKIDISKLTAGFGGLRPLLSAETSKSTKSLLRDHEVEIDPVSGLVSLLGGKWTTYRLMAKDAVDQIDLLFNQRNECTTQSHKLAGGAGYQYENYKKLSAQYGLPVDVCQHLVKKYGSRAEQVCILTAHDASLKERIVPAHCFIKAEVIYTVRNEMVETPRDFLARRTRLEIIDWKATLAALPVVAVLMAEELHWTEEQRASETTTYQQILNKFMAAAE
ncbi:FAD-dependent oxidoreductase [Dyadobacter luteus]|uniref:FAD-dependent oxidoreductase n=1 Tax=Dyadobacter luteus TaxID=2259619 RepID=A0A3D8Y8A5_9BACT|nr:FAD-dependent oxidoreductase [Dyadobacter luteus]REA59448.1 FAD-dependent oxidoreductase [Dyadobacter luteus]